MKGTMYICCPSDNVEYAADLVRLAYESGYSPISSAYLYSALGVTAAKAVSMDILGGCGRVLLGDRHGISIGMAGEIQYAQWAGKTIVKESELRKMQRKAHEAP